MGGNRKWLIIALGLSLAVNVFVAGLVIGKGFKRPPPFGGLAKVEFNLRKFAKYLSPAQRREVRQTMAMQKKIMRDNFLEMKKSEQHIRDLITAETVDHAALMEALETHAGHKQKMQLPMRRVVAEVILDLDRETRIEMAKDIFDRPRQRGEKGAHRERFR